MSDYTIPTSNTVTTIDPQATKIRELQSDVNELKELVEYLQDRIKRLEGAIDRASKRFFDDGSDGKIAAEMLTILGEMVDEEES